jgi:DNA mismatch repair protein MutS2
VLREAERLKTEARQEALAEVAEELAGARGLLRRLQARASVPVATETPPAEIAEARAELKAVEQQVRDITWRSRLKPVPRERFRIGDRVEVRSLGMQGEIVDLSEETGEADIQVGIFKVRQPVAVLRRADLPEPDPAAHTRYSLPPAPVVNIELHLRGMRAAEVQQELDRYLDAAARASLPWVRLVHGKGTGALRGVVHDVLRHHQVVDRFELAEPKAGGEGVTVAYLKD